MKSVFHSHIKRNLPLYRVNPSYKSTLKFDVVKGNARKLNLYFF